MFSQLKKYYFLLAIMAFVFAQSCQPNIRFASKSVTSNKSLSKSNDKRVDEYYSNEEFAYKITKEAESWLGTPYKYGGNSRTGIDCSALVLQVYTSMGENIPRTSQQQFEFSQHINFVDKEPGDLLFFKNAKSVNHVGIYVGNGYMIHASTSNGVIKQSIFDSYFMNKLAGVGRIKK